MNCDQVFDILTRGPFPTGAPIDLDVEEHLAHCASCHRLADALRPALDLFQESVSAAEGRDLPGYWGDLESSPDVRLSGPMGQLTVVSSALHRRLAPARRWLRHRSAHRGLRMAGAVVLGVTLGMILRSASLNEGSSHHTISPVAASAQTNEESGWNQTWSLRTPETASDRRHQILRPLGLNTACFNIDLRRFAEGDDQPQMQVTQLLAMTDYDRLSCCTECHSAGVKSVSSKTTNAVAKSCAACHYEGATLQ